MPWWGGVECTVNRVGDHFHDQLAASGHDERESDLDLFKELGFARMRYPVLWERVAPRGLKSADWSWSDRRLAKLRRHGIAPIVGLLHHGSGPEGTSLVDPQFPEKLAAYAAAVAERYPWVDAYTPVNEPLTTARFSGLYGHWYPHGKDDRTFCMALLNQCQGVALAMRAIRRVNPEAMLVQTEDLARIFSTKKLRYQARFENDRRWLTFDLLMGRVTPEHPMWRYFRWAGVDKSRLLWFLRNPCPPDLLGLNHYATSNRFLDERLERYPASSHGSNGTHRYADVEAVRVLPHEQTALLPLLCETWRRYRRPMAITEAHLGCTREEQLRWLEDVSVAAESARKAGVDLVAVTAWSLLGTFDWSSLCTVSRGHYEPGLFSLRDNEPRATALAKLVRAKAAGKEFDHPVLDELGWWKRPERLFHPSPVARPPRRVRKVLITGATGTLGSAFARMCERRGIPYRLVDRKELDIADGERVEAVLEELRPWAVINAAGYVRVDQAESEPEACFRENARGARTLAESCGRHGTRLVTFSSDLVFDGSLGAPYTESSHPAPLNVYGKSKAEAETSVLAHHPEALVVRTSAFFGPWDRHNFVTVCRNQLAAGEKVIAADDAVVSPTYVPDLVNASLDLLIDEEHGVWHVANPGAISWAALARQVAELSGADASRVEGIPQRALNLPARRPSYSVLGSERAILLQPLEGALAQYFRETA